MMDMKRFLFLFLFLCSATVFIGPGLLSATDSEQWSLRGTQELSILVETIPPDLRDAGLSERKVLSDVKTNLRLLNIPVASGADSYLYINVNGYRSSNDIFVYSVRAEFKQPVMLLRSAEARVTKSKNADILAFFWKGRPQKGRDKGFTAQEMMRLHFSEIAATWDSAMVGSVGTDRNPVDTIRGAIKELVVEFANDFFAAKQEKARIEQKNRVKSP